MPSSSSCPLSQSLLTDDFSAVRGSGLFSNYFLALFLLFFSHGFYHRMPAEHLLVWWLTYRLCSSLDVSIPLTRRESDWVNHPPVLKSLWDRIPLSNHLLGCCVCAQSINHVQVLVTPWPVTHQTPLSMGSSRQEHWRWLPFSYSRGSFRLRGWTSVSCIGRWILYHWATREATVRLLANL